MSHWNWFDLVGNNVATYFVLFCEIIKLQSVKLIPKPELKTSKHVGLVNLNVNMGSYGLFYQLDIDIKSVSNPIRFTYARLVKLTPLSKIT